MDAVEPWKRNKRWRDNLISSQSRHAHWALAGFALIWNLLTLPLYFQFSELWAKAQSEPLIVIALVFPLVGIGLVVAVIGAWRQWRRFGPTPLVLDPFPGSVGGQVGGWLDIGTPFSAGQQFAVTLVCLRSSISGSGKNRSRSESVCWQTDGICHAERSVKGTLLRFRFDVPAGLPATDVEKSGSYHLWRVTITSEMEGPDFDRRFEIPVFATGECSGIQFATETYAATRDQASESVESIAEFTAIPGGIEVMFPAFQRPAQGVLCMLFGLGFLGTGIALGFADDVPLVFPLTFTPVGAAIALYGLHYLGKSLLVAVTRERLRCRRFLFGYPITTRELDRASFRQFELVTGATMTSGNKTTVFYRVYALGQHGEKFPVAERLTSRAEAELLKETYQAYFSV